LKYVVLLLLLTVIGLYALDLDVDEAVKIGLKNSLELETLRTKLHKAQLDIDVAKATVFPVISGQMGYTRLGNVPTFDLPKGAFGTMGSTAFPPTDVSIPMGFENNYMTSLTATQPLFLGGRDWTAIRLSKTYTKAIEEQIKGEELNMRLKIKEAFYQALLAEKMSVLMELTYSNAQRHLEQVGNLRKGGAITSYDLLRARVQVANLKPQVQSVKSGSNLAKQALLIALRLPAQTPLTLKGDFPYKPSTHPVPNLEECIKIGQTERTELKQLDHTLKILKGTVSIYRAGHYPSLVAVGNLNWTANEFKFKKDTWTNDWNVSLILSIPIFSGFKVVTETKKAQCDVDNAELGRKQILDGIELQIRAQYNALTLAKENFEGLEANITEAEMSVEMATTRYKSGATTQIEYFDSELALQKARTLYIQGLYDYTIAWLKLHNAMGKPI